MTSLEKHDLLRDLAHRFGIDVLIETGSHEGATPMALATHFASIHTVEKDRQLAARVSMLFQLYSNVTPWSGDSPTILNERLLPAVRKPFIIFLDANTGPRLEPLPVVPLMQELQAVLTSAQAPYIIVVDDVDRLGAKPFPNEYLVRGILDGTEIDVVQTCLVARHPFIREVV